MAHRNTKGIIGIWLCAVALLGVSCAPADYLEVNPPPLRSINRTPAWEPVAIPTRAPSPAPRVFDDSLLSGHPCAPPCWQGLTPGITAETEVHAFLDNSPYVADWQREKQLNGSVEYKWHWASPNHAQNPNVMQVRDALLARITLTPDTPATLAQVLATFGAPAQVDIHTPAGADALEWTLDAYYPERGLRLTLTALVHTDDGDQICPVEETYVQTATYLPAGDIDTLIAAAYDVLVERDMVLGRLHTWDGESCLAIKED